MKSKKIALAVSIGVMAVMAVSIMAGCSSTQTEAKTSTSTPQKQFIEVHVAGKGAEYININHIVSVHPNGNATSILMDTSDGMNGGFISVTDSYDSIVKELNQGNQ